MTLDAGVVGMHVVEAARIENGRAHGMVNVRAARTVTPFAADIPFADAFGGDVIIHRVTAVAQRSGWSLEIVRRIKRCPPIGIVGYEIPFPLPVRDIPLRRLWEIIIIDLCKVALFPAAAVNKRDVVL